MSLPIVGKTFVATLAMCGFFTLSSGVATLLVPVPQTDASGGEMLAKLLLVCLANTTVLVAMLTRISGHGTRLAGIVFLLHFGVAAFMSQNETLYFNAALTLPLSVVASVVASYAVSAALFAPFVVWLFGRTQPAAPGSERAGLGLTDRALAGKCLFVAAVLYPTLYFLFGYFVLWQIPEARLLYQGSRELVPFVEHMTAVFENDPWLLPWQALRGLMWILLAVPVMRRSLVGWRETAVVVGLLFAILLSVQLLIPNPYMPPPVQLGHFIETATSNFVLGFFLVAILRPRG